VKREREMRARLMRRRADLEGRKVRTRSYRKTRPPRADNSGMAIEDFLNRLLSWLPIPRSKPKHPHEILEEMVRP
jgi:hypothetical protein